VNEIVDWDEKFAEDFAIAIEFDNIFRSLDPSMSWMAVEQMKFVAAAMAAVVVDDNDDCRPIWDNVASKFYFTFA
jgi:hypothetical protein